jgi:hypothetical protein
MRSLFACVPFLCLIACTSKPKVQPSNTNSIMGTWELISASTIQGDSTIVKDLSNKRMIKIINETHFSFLDHDLNKGEDSLATFVAGGGSYTLTGDKYSEFLEYCNYREWERNSFDFTIQVKGDTLIQNGLEELEELGVDRIITEVYIKTIR